MKLRWLFIVVFILAPVIPACAHPLDISILWIAMPLAMLAAIYGLFHLIGSRTQLGNMTG